jgi:hypothetical protein
MTNTIELRCYAKRDGYGKWCLHIDGLRDILDDAARGIEKTGAGAVVGSPLGSLTIRLLGRVGDATHPIDEARRP